MIRQYGIRGAVYATVITQTLSLLILNIAFRETRKIFIIQVKSLLLLGIWRKQ